jgi:methylaspartate mutase sigma subunit
MEPDQPGNTALDIVVTGMSSDAHTWNLVYLELFLEEMGHRVTNLGACVPDEVLVEACRERPDLVVVSTVNGHGAQDGLRAIRAIRRCPDLAATPVVIGGKLDTVGGADGGHVERLLAAGFDAVFDDGGLSAFRAFVAALPAAAAQPVRA